MSTKKITINKSNGTKNEFTFNIPATAGTYKLTFINENGQTINGGNITVPNGPPNIYNLKFGLSNGTQINVGNFDTSGWRTVFQGSKTINNNTENVLSYETFSGVKANTPTKITYSGGVIALYEELGEVELPITSQMRESQQGYFADSTDFNESGAWGYYIQINNNSVGFYGFANGDEVIDDSYNVVGFSRAFLNVVKIEQYY